MLKYLYLIILYQKIINILILRAIEQARLDYPVCSTEQMDIGMVLQAELQ